VVNGGTQTGDVLSTRGWPNSTANIFRAGDFLSWADPTGRAQLHQVVLDAGSNGSGVCAITITPSIRRSPADGVALNVTAPVGLFRLSEDAVRQRHRPGFITEFTINIEEALA
jgi:hypothetical protein